MKVKVRKNQKVTTWSGGTTTELLIYPDTANVAEKNFDFRISTANVLVENSEFTFFPGYHRKLAILEGKLKVKHNEGDWFVLKENEQIDFEGDWKTVSEGKVVDFNVIYNRNYKVEMDFMENIHNRGITEENEVLAYYCVKGSGVINSIPFEEGSFILVNNLIVSCNILEKCLFVQVCISKL